MTVGVGRLTPAELPAAPGAAEEQSVYRHGRKSATARFRRDFSSAQLVRFDDFARQSYRSNFAVGAGRFYFAISDRESDVWVAELTTR